MVGVDGSDASREALRWGAEEARLRIAPLVAVHDPGMLAMPAGDLPGQLSAESDAARMALDEVLSEALGSEPGIEIERKLVEGDAGDALVAESASAELVVVGSHGRSGLKAAILGSVSRHVVDHAAFPVVVVKSSG